MDKHLKAAVAGFVTTLAITGAAALPAQAAKPDPKQLVVNAAMYSALGDSFAAGVGAGASTKENGQTLQAYPVLLASKVNKVTFLAQTGATTTDVLTEQVAWIPATATQVTLTVGGNDLDFVGTIQTCLSGTQTQCAETITGLQATLAGMPARVGQVIAAIEQQAPNATIYVTGYPLLFQAVPNDANEFCVAGTDPNKPGGLLLVPESLTNQIDVATGALNTAISAAVSTADAADGVPGDVTYVNVADDFLGHGLCGTPSSGQPNAASYIQPIHLTSAGTIDPTKPAPLHPTAAGQQAYAAAIRDAGFENRTLAKG